MYNESLDSSAIEIVVLHSYTPDIKSENQIMSLIAKLIKKGEEGHINSLISAGDSAGKVVISEITKMNILPQDALTKGFNVFGPN